MNRFGVPWPAVGLCLIGLFAAIAARSARGQDAPAPPAASEAPPSGPTEQDRRAHYAEGQILRGDRWVAAEKVFGDYLAMEVDMQPVLEKGKEARRKDYQIARQITQLRNQERAKRAPLYRERGQLHSRKSRLEAIQRMRPPPPPRLLREPDPPNRSSYGRTGTYGNDGYEDARRRYERERERVHRENERRKEEYRQKVEALKKAQAEAKKEEAEIEQKLADIARQMEDLRKETDAKIEPLIRQRKDVNDEVAALRSKAAALVSRRAGIKKALTDAPAEVLWREGIVGWEDDFHRLADLRKRYAETAAQIDRVRSELKAAAEKAGREFPRDYRHPWQDKQDELKALLDRVAPFRDGR